MSTRVKGWVAKWVVKSQPEHRLKPEEGRASREQSGVKWVGKWVAWWVAGARNAALLGNGAIRDVAEQTYNPSLPGTLCLLFMRTRIYASYLCGRIGRFRCRRVFCLLLDVIYPIGAFVFCGGGRKLSKSFVEFRSDCYT